MCSNVLVSVTNTPLLSTGLGAGAGAALFAELARTSRKKERTIIFSIFSSMRQLGLIIGMQVRQADSAIILE